MEREDRQLFNCKKKLEPPSSCLSPKIFTQVGAMMKRLFDKYPRKGKKKDLPVLCAVLKEFLIVWTLFRYLMY